MANEQNARVYLIILNWNGKNDSLECLSSTQQITYPNLVTVVVDNGSTDGSAEAIKAAFPEVTLLLTGKNLGYAEGNNVGIRHAMEHGADYVFVLNNDTTVDPEVVSALVSVAEQNSNAAILGPKIYFYDKPDIINSAGGHINFETLERGHIGYGFREDGLSYSTVTPLEWITGCALLFRVSALRQIGLLDPDFFLICEELDLCARARRQGYEILFVPESKIWHKVSAAFEGNYSPVYCYYMFRNILLYVRKNFQSKRGPLYRLLVRQSHEFYKSLVQKGDPDCRKKGFCIFMGTLHFFLGMYGSAPSWLFKIKIPKKKQTLVDIDQGKDLFKGEIMADNAPIQGKAGATIHLPVMVRNLSEATWPAFSSAAVRLSYHLRDENGKTITWDGQRTVLPKNLRSGKRMTLNAVLQLPDDNGRYTLEWDLVQESVAWFSKRGLKTTPLTVIVK